MGLTPTNTSVEAATVDRKGFTFNLPSIPNDFDSASPKARSRLFCCVASSSGVTTCTPKINGSVIDMGSGGFLLILGKIGLRAALISSANRNDSPSPGVYRTLGPAPANRAHALAIAACCSAVSSRGCICALSSAVRCSASAARGLACLPCYLGSRARFPVFYLQISLNASCHMLKYQFSSDSNRYRETAEQGEFDLSFSIMGSD